MLQGTEFAHSDIPVRCESTITEGEPSPMQSTMYEAHGASYHASEGLDFSCVFTAGSEHTLAPSLSMGAGLGLKRVMSVHASGTGLEAWPQSVQSTPRAGSQGALGMYPMDADAQPNGRRAVSHSPMALASSCPTITVSQAKASGASSSLAGAKRDGCYNKADETARLKVALQQEIIVSDSETDPSPISHPAASPPSSPSGRRSTRHLKLPRGWTADSPSAPSPKLMSSSVTSVSTDEASSSGCTTPQNAKRRVHATAGSNGRRLLVTPWYPQGVGKKGLSLRHEVMALATMLRLTDEEKSLRQVLRTSVQQVVSTVWPGVTVKVFGSFAYGLSLPSSPVDLVVELYSAEELQQVPAVLEHISEAGIEVASSVVNADCGFAKLHIPGVGIDANLLFSLGKSTSRQCVADTRRRLKEYPAAADVFSICRILLKQANCGDGATSGLSSYALLHMIFAFCAEFKNPRDTPQLLLGFLRKYAEPVPDLVVRDPVNEGNNLVAGCRRLTQVFSVFKNTLTSLEKWTTVKLDGFRGRTPLSSVLAYEPLWADKRVGNVTFL